MLIFTQMFFMDCVECAFHNASKIKCIRSYFCGIIILGRLAKVFPLWPGSTKITPVSVVMPCHWEKKHHLSDIILEVQRARVDFPDCVSLLAYCFTLFHPDSRAARHVWRMAMAWDRAIVTRSGAEDRRTNKAAA